MKTRHQFAAAALALATLAFGCDDGATPADGSPPVAVSDTVRTDLDTPVMLHPTANDVADAVGLAPQTIDLDSDAAGQQVEHTTAAGTFTLLQDGDVLFAPAAGFMGYAVVSYVVADVAGRLSNPAELMVIVGTRPPSATGTEPLAAALVLSPLIVPADPGGPAPMDRQPNQ